MTYSPLYISKGSEISFSMLISWRICPILINLSTGLFLFWTGPTLQHRLIILFNFLWNKWNAPIRNWLVRHALGKLLKFFLGNIKKNILDAPCHAMYRVSNTRYVNRVWSNMNWPCLILATNPDTQYWTTWQHSLQSLLTIVAVYGNSSGQTSVTIAISYSTITHAWFVLIHTVYINTQQTTCNHLLKNSVHCRRTPTVCVSHSWLRLRGEPVL